MSRGCGFDDAIQRLFASLDFAAQQRLGHQLIRGAALTSMSEEPFEMRLKCGLCDAVMWFENIALPTGERADWRLAAESHEYAAVPCRARVAMISGRVEVRPSLRP
ncbi:MAG: hypothetical protein ACREQN_01710 [Candidatus Binataceae bacterium]